jgi:hypothetical protein
VSGLYTSSRDDVVDQRACEGDASDKLLCVAANRNGGWASHLLHVQCVLRLLEASMILHS